MLEVMQPASWKSGSSVRSGVVGLEKLLVEGGENDLFEGELGLGGAIQKSLLKVIWELDGEGL